MNIILRYFPHLTPEQIEKFTSLETLYNFWNQRINLISRKDIGDLYERHVLHSLSIGKIICFRPGTRVLDAGTGGGFPGIPLAVLFPGTNFYLVDSMRKKIHVVNSIAKELRLYNVTTEQIRAEQLMRKFDFIVSRAVTDLSEFVRWTGKNIAAKGKNSLPNGIMMLKGGNLDNEIKSLQSKVYIYNLSELFSEAFFETKKLVYIPV